MLFRSLQTLLTERLEACRDRLESVQDHRFEQGYAKAIREILKIGETAEAVLKQRNREG